VVFGEGRGIALIAIAANVWVIGTQSLSDENGRMRQSPAGRRARGRPNRRPHSPAQRNSNFDSNGPEGRVRGTAHQVYEKYCSLGRDSFSAGDRVQAETYFQHAEHYFRVLNSSTDPQPDELNGRSPRQAPQAGDSQSNGNGADAQGLQPELARQDAVGEESANEASPEEAAVPDKSAEPAAAPDGGGEEAASQDTSRGRRRTLRSRKPSGNSRKAPDESGDSSEQQDDGGANDTPRAAKSRGPRQPRRAGAARKAAEPEAPAAPESDGE
jgi:hypothetical protein